MVSVAELKAKAHKAKEASVTKFQDTRDRYSSVSTAKTGYDPDWRKNAPPAPPPPRSSNDSPQSSASTPLRPPPSRPPPPVVRHTTRPGHEAGRDESMIDWANLSPEDKQVFFGWLDEFFARYFNISAPSSSVAKPMPPPVVNRSSAPKASTSPLPPTRGPPPTVNARSRPSMTPTTSPKDISDFVLSFPAPTIHGSAALDLAHFFHPSTHWDTPWYQDLAKSIPPPLQGNTQITYTTAWQSYGPTNTLFTGVLFADLSVCWTTVQFSATSNADPNKSSLVRRSAHYLPRPRPMDKAALVEAHETYGESIAAFAESFEGTDEFCAHGECWDLANEALKFFDAYDYVPKPVPSLSRTHGHLIFEGKAMGKGNMAGRWRGGDDRVRRGDIVEWRNVKINTVDASPYSWVTLGEPDHTAVIVRDSQPSRPPVNGQSLSPVELGSLEVVEQSVTTPPQRKNYDLNAFEAGEMWIYRPVGMKAYLGALLVAKCPDDVQVLTL